MDHFNRSPKNSFKAIARSAFATKQSYKLLKIFKYEIASLRSQRLDLGFFRNLLRDDGFSAVFLPGDGFVKVTDRKEFVGKGG